MKRTFIYNADATEGTGGDTALIMKSIAELGNGLETKQKESIEAVKKEIGEQVVTAKGELETVTKELATVKSELTEIKKKAGRLILNGEEDQKVKSFNQILAETIEANLTAITKTAGSIGEQRYRLKGFESGEIEVVKAVGDMSTSANFTGYANYVTDFRRNIVEVPYNNVYLADVIPNENSASGASVMYPKENGGEGGAALWTDPTADKAQMDFDLTTQQAFFKWIAGYVIVGREMLDDIPFMLGYIQARMLRSLKTAENDFILNGSSDSNPVSGIDDLATAYSGGYTDAVRMVLDAAYGQIPEDTNNFYNPTTLIMRPRRAVEIGLNQASGSGEFDLPAGSAAFANGRLSLAGLQTVTTSQVGAQDFYVLDRMALSFIRRMQPELIQVVDSTLAKKNKIMFRIEERATLVGFNNAAIVKGTLPTVG